MGGMYFLQTSAKNCDNVDRLFTEIAHELLQQAKAKDLPSESHSVQNISESSIGQSSSVKSIAAEKLREVTKVTKYAPKVSRVSTSICRAFFISNCKVASKIYFCFISR